MAKTKRDSRGQQLRDELDQIEAALDEARGAPPELVETQKQVAALTGNYWLARRRLAAHEGDFKAEVNCDRRHNEALTLFGKLAEKSKADLLKKVMARLEEISQLEDDFQAEIRRRATRAVA